MRVISLRQNMPQCWTISPRGNNGEWLSRIETQIYSLQKFLYLAWSAIDAAEFAMTHYELIDLAFTEVIKVLWDLKA